LATRKSEMRYTAFERDANGAYRVGACVFWTLAIIVVAMVLVVALAVGVIPPLTWPILGGGGSALTFIRWLIRKFPA